MKAKHDPQTCPHADVKHFTNCNPPRTWCQDCGTRVDAEAVAVRDPVVPEAPVEVAPPVVQPEPPSQDIDDALQQLEQEVKPEESAGGDDGVFSGIRKRLTGDKKTKKN